MANYEIETRHESLPDEWKHTLTISTVSDDSSGKRLVEGICNFLTSNYFYNCDWRVKQVNTCNGCIYYYPGSNLYSGTKLCTLDAGNNCLKRAEDYYTPKDKQ